MKLHIVHVNGDNGCACYCAVMGQDTEDAAERVARERYPVEGPIPKYEFYLDNFWVWSIEFDENGVSSPWIIYE